MKQSKFEALLGKFPITALLRKKLLVAYIKALTDVKEFPSNK